MRVLIDIGHPAHVHYFRNLYHEMKEKHEITVTCKLIPIVTNLLKAYNVPYIQLGEKGSGLIRKFERQLSFNKQIYKLIQEHDIDLAMGLSFSVVHAAKFTKALSLLFDDDDQLAQPITAKYVSPFADTVLSPDVLKFERLKKAVYYPGYHELAYLHPNRFTPDPQTLTKYGVSPTEKYSILRFNAFKAHHDVREGGMDKQQKLELIRLLSAHGRVFITTEAELDREFEQYKLPIAPHEMHDCLFYSQLLVSDSQTMSTEAAVLGVPAFRCNSFAGRLSVLEEEEKKYGLTYAFLPRQFDWMYAKIAQHLESSDRKEEWKLKRQKMLQDKIDVTAFWLWFINNYPASISDVQKMSVDFDQFKR